MQQVRRRQRATSCSNVAFNIPVISFFHNKRPLRSCICEKPTYHIKHSWTCRVDIDNHETHLDTSSTTVESKSNNNAEKNEAPQNTRYVTGRRLLEEDLSRLRSFLTQLADSNSKIPNFTRDDESSSKEETPSSVLSRFSNSPSYEPRSRTGQTVAKTFAQMRGAVERAISTTSVRAKHTLQTIILAAVTLSTSVQSVTIRIIRATPIDTEESGGWNILSSFRWQQSIPVKEKLKTANGQYAQQIHSVNKIQQNRRKQTIQRAHTVREFRNRTAVSIRKISRVSSFIFTKMWPKTIAILPIGRKGGAIVGVGLGTALATIVYMPVAGIITGTAVAVTSVAFISVQAGVVDKMNEKKNNAYPRRQQAMQQAQQSTKAYSNVVDPKSTERLKKVRARETIETAAYSVSRPKPSILSIPILGFILNMLDILAFSLEKGALFVSSRLFKSSFSKPLAQQNDGWILLHSFIETN